MPIQAGIFPLLIEARMELPRSQKCYLNKSSSIDKNGLQPGRFGHEAGRKGDELVVSNSSPLLTIADIWR